MSRESLSLITAKYGALKPNPGPEGWERSAVVIGRR